METYVSTRHYRGDVIDRVVLCDWVVKGFVSILVNYVAISWVVIVSKRGW